MGPDARADGTVRRLIVWDGVFSRLMDTLTGGVFLAGLGLFLGADNLTIGVLAAMPLLAQGAQIFAVRLLVERPVRKRIVLLASATSRTILAVVAALMLLRGDAIGAGTLTALVTVSAAAAVVSSAAWNWWMRDLLPRGELGRFFGRRLAIATLPAAAASLVAGAALDRLVRSGSAPQGYAALFAVGWACGMVSLAFLARTPHAPPAVEPRKGPIVGLLLAPLRREGSRGLLVALSLVAATVTFSLPFTAVYLLRSVGYGFLEVTVMALVSQLAYVGGLRGWGLLSDRFGDVPVLRIAFGMLVFALGGWAVTGSGSGPLLLAVFLLLHFVVGFAMGGIELASGNVVLKSAPDDEAPAFLAGAAFVRALAAAAATLSAAVLWQLAGRGPLVEFALPGGAALVVRGFHLLSAVAAALGVAALVALSGLREQEGAPVHVVARAMRREVHAISSVAGIRGFVHVASYVVEFVARPPGARAGRGGRRPPTTPP